MSWLVCPWHSPFPMCVVGILAYLQYVCCQHGQARPGVSSWLVCLGQRTHVDCKDEVGMAWIARSRGGRWMWVQGADGRMGMMKMLMNP